MKLACINILVGCFVVCIFSPMSVAFNSSDKETMNEIGPYELTDGKNPNCVYHNGECNTTYNLVKLECGGVISLPKDGQPILLDYKSSETYNSDENCLWIFDTVIDKARYNVKLRITLECAGFVDVGDEVAILQWKNDDKVSTSLLRRQGDVHEQAESNWLYLSFSSNSRLQGQGFIVRVEVALTNTKYAGSNWAFNYAPGNFTYGPNKKNDRIAVVINPRAFTLTNRRRDVKLVASVDTNQFKGFCVEVNSLHIFTVGLKGVSTIQKILCGRQNSFKLQTTYPILVLYRTSGNPSGTGFWLRWS